MFDHSNSIINDKDNFAGSQNKLKKENYISQIEALDKEEKEFAQKISGCDKELETMFVCIQQLFDTTGLKTDDFIDLFGCQKITQNNFKEFLGCFEVMADKLLNENEGHECHDADIEEQNDFYDESEDE